jgi:hypothetical protein
MDHIRKLLDLEEYICTYSSAFNNIYCYGPFDHIDLDDDKLVNYYETQLVLSKDKKIDSATIASTYKNYPQWLKQRTLSKSFYPERISIVQVDLSQNV